MPHRCWARQCDAVGGPSLWMLLSTSSATTLCTIEQLPGTSPSTAAPRARRELPRQHLRDYHRSVVGGLASLLEHRLRPGVRGEDDALGDLHECLVRLVHLGQPRLLRRAKARGARQDRAPLHRFVADGGDVCGRQRVEDGVAGEHDDVGLTHRDAPHEALLRDPVTLGILGDMLRLASDPGRRAADALRVLLLGLGVGAEHDVQCPPTVVAAPE
mmetsp:Transcript_93418/g.243482  ORF Transcript_93418/g.243482 Transcript_93418/m.243482 type:complete len:215 (-) Transcript_93418:439-1083(-)